MSPEAAAVNEALAAATSWRQLNAVLEQQSRPGMPGLDAYQLVDIMLRLTRRDMVIPQEGDDLADFQQFIASVFGWMLERMPTMKPMQVTNAIFAIGRLNLYNAELMDALLQRLDAGSVGDMRATQLSKFLSGLSALNLAPPAELQEALMSEQVAANIERSAQRDEVGVILSSCQRLGLAPSQEWLSPLAESFLANIDSKDKVSMMRTDNFVRPLVGLAGMGWKPSAEQWQTLLDAAAQLMPLGYYRGRQLLETAWAFAQFGNPVPNSWSQAFNYQLWGQSQYLPPADIGALLYSMAYIKARPNPNQLQRLLDNITSRSDRAGGDDFANVVLALAQFNYTPTDAVFDDMLIQLSNKLPTCSAAGLNNIIAALPAMGNGVRLRQVVDAAVARYDAMLAEQQYGAGDEGQQLPAADEAAAAEQAVA